MLVRILDKIFIRKSEPLLNTRENIRSEENKREDIEKDFSVIRNIGSGSNKDLRIDICSDYFNFDKKELNEKKIKKENSAIERIKKLKKDYCQTENKKEDEIQNSYKSFLNASSFNSKISFSNKSSFDSTSMSFEKIDEFLNEKDPQILTNNLNNFVSKPKTFILLNKKMNELTLTKEEWLKIISNNSFINIEKERLIKSIIKGIPQELRGKIWIVFSKSLNISENHPSNCFENLIVKKNKKLENEIRKDIERTFLDITEEKQKEILSSKKNDLFNILKAYGENDPDVGYSQGTNFIVFCLLSNVKIAKDAYWIFFQIMFDKCWRFLYIHNTPKLNLLLEKLDREIKNRLPLLYSVMERENFIDYIPGSFSHFFTTLFTYEVPIQYSFKIIDLFLLLGEKILIECLIILLKLKENKLIKMCSEEMQVYIKKKLVRECVNENNIEILFPRWNPTYEETEISIDLK